MGRLSKNRVWKRVVFGAALFGLAACAKPAPELPPNQSAEILQSFQLVVPENERGISVGVLLYIPERGAMTVCSAGRVHDVLVSNAHCVSEVRNAYGSASPSRFFVVYPDKETGAKRIGRILRFAYEGREDYDDVLVGEVDKETLEHWGSFHSVGKVIDDQPQEGTLWAFDPVPSEARAIGSPQAMGINRFGAVYSKKRLKFSRQVPRIGRPQSYGSFSPNGKKLNSEIHLFLDSISPTTVKGNSGGIITSVEGDVVGTFHWQREKRSFAENDWYYGSDRRWKPIWSRELDIPQSWVLVGVGTQLFPYLL